MTEPMEARKQDRLGRSIATALGIVLIFATLHATGIALTTLFYFDFPGWSEGAPPIAVTMGYYAAPVILLTAAIFAFRAAMRFSIKRLLSALIPVGGLILYLTAAHIWLNIACSQPLGYTCS